MQSFTNIKALIIDMDGVLWHGNKALPGLESFFQLLRKRQLPFILATNNASLTQNQYLTKLKSMGITVSLEEILTSSMATAHYLSTQTPPKSTNIFIIGEEGLRLPFSKLGFNLIDNFEDESKSLVDFVICGLDRKLTWEKLADASLHLHHGAKFIASNADTSLPTERGPVTGNGAILAALTATTGISPKVIGKPEAFMYQHAIKILGVEAEKTIAIGDRLDTDILGAVNTGIRSIMVLSGISSKEDLKSVDYHPTWIMPDLQDITKALSQMT